MWEKRHVLTIDNMTFMDVYGPRLTNFGELWNIMLRWDVFGICRWQDRSSDVKKNETKRQDFVFAKRVQCSSN